MWSQIGEETKKKMGLVTSISVPEEVKLRSPGGLMWWHLDVPSGHCQIDRAGAKLV